MSYTDYTQRCRISQSPNSINTIMLLCSIAVSSAFNLQYCIPRQFSSLRVSKTDSNYYLSELTDNYKTQENFLQANKTFFIETHGCQMNLADSDIVRSVLLTAGYEMCDILEEADLILTNTCAIRENAESKIWQRLKYFQSLRKKAKLSATKPSGYPLIGVLGCMAERLKTELLADTGVDFIAGPDAYRTLPDLLRVVTTTDQKAGNTILSLDETYADIPPVRLAEGNTHAFVTITRGCDNHCAFCVVPYTRGKERSRPVSSILSEICALRDQGFREVVLLGQNVNSYHDRLTPPKYYPVRSVLDDTEGQSLPSSYSLATGFSEKKVPIPMNLRKPRQMTVDIENDDDGDDVSNSVSPATIPDESHPTLFQSVSNVSPSVTLHDELSVSGSRFGELLLRVAEIDPEMRIRFQSPHPKDFPDDLLTLIATTPNICNSLHMPAQHGASTALERMRRGYTREAYEGLVHRARNILGGSDGSAGMGLSTDLIAGFCGETDEEHQASLSLLRTIGYDQAFTYAYSRREQTFAGLFLQDDVPEHVKSARLQELVDTFQATALSRNREIEIGRLHLVLVEGEGKGSSPDAPVWTGRTDTNKRVVFPGTQRIVEQVAKNDILSIMQRTPLYSDIPMKGLLLPLQSDISASFGTIKKGEYVVVQITDARGHTLRGSPVGLSSLSAWADIRPAKLAESAR